MGEENMFYCWAGFEPSKSAIFGKKHVTALGSASCCKINQFEKIIKSLLLSFLIGFG